MPEPERARRSADDGAENGLSIVMPVLDEAAGIVARLQSLQPLRRQGVELIVVDGGSQDDTVSLAGPLADRVVTTDRGRGRQMNAGAVCARGNALLFLHADTALPLMRCRPCAGRSPAVPRGGASMFGSWMGLRASRWSPGR